MENKTHEFITGMTRHGKTYHVIRDMERARLPVLFFNTQHEKTPFIKADAGDSIETISAALNRGKKVDYLPNFDMKKAQKELEYIVHWLFVTKKVKELILVVDEVHQFAPQGKDTSQLLTVARMGLRYGIYGRFISQRPADVSKMIVTQCLKHKIFYLGEFERGYFSSYGLPYDRIKEMIEQGGQYSYVVLEDGKLTGPFKE